MCSATVRQGLWEQVPAPPLGALCWHWGRREPVFDGVRFDLTPRRRHPEARLSRSTEVALTGLRADGKQLDNLCSLQPRHTLLPC